MKGLNISEDIRSLTEFKRNTAEFMGQLEATGRPLVLTVNGEAKIVVQDAAAYQRLLEQIDRLEAIEGIRKGLESMKEGRGISFEQFKREMEKKYNLPSKRPGKK
jgi:prevent-host-death family protein